MSSCGNLPVYGTSIVCDPLRCAYVSRLHKPDRRLLSIVLLGYISTPVFSPPGLPLIGMLGATKQSSIRTRSTPCGRLSARSGSTARMTPSTSCLVRRVNGRPRRRPRLALSGANQGSICSYIADCLGASSRAKVCARAMHAYAGEALIFGFLAARMLPTIASHAYQVLELLTRSYTPISTL